MDSSVLSGAARRLFGLCKGGGLKVCAAESCTGGLVASSIVSISGASAVFAGSAVCYCDAAKERVLGVKRETLEKFFAESPECAREMAKGALDAFGADLAVSATGFLDASVGEKPASLAGKVFFCVRAKGGTSADASISLDPDAGRAENRARAALAAVELLISEILKNENTA
ncbi:MAG: CinA family protein [Opitutales bacterium]|nr:CinA family protein [Opitutales bacterium]